MEPLGTGPSLMLAPHCGTLVPLAYHEYLESSGFQAGSKDLLFHLPGKFMHWQ